MNIGLTQIRKDPRFIANAALKNTILSEVKTACDELLAGQQTLFVEKPRVLCRIFIKISALLSQSAGYKSWISFDDPSFSEYYTIDGSTSYFQAKGEGIFQGNIWVRNQSSVNIGYTATEILV